MTVVTDELFRFDVVSDLPIFVDASSFVPRTSTETATSRDDGQGEYFEFRSCFHALNIVLDLNLAVFDLNVALDYGQDPRIAQRVLQPNI